MYNGAILLGLDKPVIKSHGSTDEIGFANSLKVCEKIIKGKLIEKIKKKYYVMRVNLTKKELVNSIYMQIGFSKKISENLLEDLLTIILDELIKNKKVKIAKFGTFILRYKKSRIGRNPKSLEEKIISERNVILFKASDNLKKYINNDE